MPDAGHLAVDEQHGVVAGLARRHQGPLPRAAREEQVPRPTADDVRVEVRQQPHALGRRSVVRRPRQVVGRLAVELDADQGRVGSHPLGRPDGRRAEPRREARGRRRTVGAQVLLDRPRHRRVRLDRVGVGRPRVGHLAGPVRAVAEHAGVRRPVGDLPPARPQRLERRHHRLGRPRTGQVADRLGELVDGQLTAAQGLADRRDHRARLVVGHPDAVGERAAPRERAEGRHPPAQVGGGQQVHRPARAEGLHERAVLPEGTAHVVARRALDPQGRGDLGRRQHLGVHAAHGGRHLGHAGAGGKRPSPGRAARVGGR